MSATNPFGIFASTISHNIDQPDDRGIAGFPHVFRCVEANRRKIRYHCFTSSLVIASNEETARALVRRAYTVEDPYGEDVSVEDVELSPAIVEGE